MTEREDEFAAESGRARERLALLESLLDSLPEFFYVHDKDLRFQYANKAAAEYFGQTKDRIVGLRHRDVDDDPEQAALYERELKPIIANGVPVRTGDLPYNRRDGSTGLLQAHIIPFQDPRTGEPMMLGLSRDVTSDRAMEDERARRAAYERELEIASQIQRSLLPSATPDAPGWDAAGRCEPAAFAGGDFFDFIEDADGNTLAVVADVVGHGVGPAIIASSARAFLRAMLPGSGMRASFAALDRQLHADLPPGSFVTMAAVALPHGSPSASYLSAGHGPMSVVRSDGAVRELTPHAPPLGLGLWPADAEPTSIDLRLGDAIVVPSDGLIESRSGRGEFFGNRGLCSQVTSDRSALACIEGAFATEESWRGEAAPDDDRTLLVMRWIGDGVG